MEHDIFVYEPQDLDGLDDLNILISEDRRIIEGIDSNNFELLGSTYILSGELNVKKLRLNISADIEFTGKINCYDKYSHITGNRVFFSNGAELINAFPKGALTILSNEYIKHDNAILYTGGGIREEAKGQDSEGRGLIFLNNSKIITLGMLFESTPYNVYLDGILSGDKGVYSSVQCISLSDQGVILGDKGKVNIALTNCHFVNNGQIVSNQLVNILVSGGDVENHNLIAGNEVQIMVHDKYNFINYAKLLTNERLTVGVWSMGKIILKEHSFTQVGSYTFGHVGANFGHVGANWQIGKFECEGCELIVTLPSEISRIHAQKLTIKVAHYQKKSTPINGPSYFAL